MLTRKTKYKTTEKQTEQEMYYGASVATPEPLVEEDGTEGQHETGSSDIKSEEEESKMNLKDIIVTTIKYVPIKFRPCLTALPL